MKSNKKRVHHFEVHHKKPRQSIIYFTILLLLFILWAFFMTKFSPDRIIESIGITNSYLIVFILCIIGGISIMFPIPYYLAVFTFAAGGSNPLLLGICAGLGLMIGDSTSYYFGYHGGKIISKKMQERAKKISHFIISRPTWLITSLLVLWGSITPFPNDMMIVPLGLIRYPYLKTIIPIGFGNIIFNTVIALSGYYGWTLFF